MNALIVTGGKINKKFLKSNLQSNNYDIIIAVDKGLETLKKINVKPSYIIGDFDSVRNDLLEEYSDVKIERLNPEKDFTDTHSGIDLAIKLGAKTINIIGGTGTRIDHVLGNINILKIALENGVKARIIDENNEINLLDKKTEIKKDNNFKYISFIPLTTKAEGVTITGFKYEVNNYTFEIGNSIGISNEQIKNVAEVDIKKGILIMIKSKD